MNTNTRNMYAGSRIEVEGHGESTTLPDLVTITFVCKIDSLEGENIYTQLEKAREKFTDALEEWETEGDFSEIASYTLEKESAKDSLSAKFEVQVTTTRLDNLPGLIKLGEKYGGHVNYNLTEFGFTREKQQDVDDSAVEQAIIGANMAFRSLSKATGIAVSHVVNVKVDKIIHEITDYVVDTIREGRGGMIVGMKKVKTTADVTVTYQVEEE